MKNYHSILKPILTKPILFRIKFILSFFCLFTIIPEAEAIDPIAICQNYSVLLDFSGTKFISPQNVNGGSFDPDGNIVDYSLDQDFFTCADLGVNVVTLTVEDNEGNTATCTANVTVSFPSQALACISQVYLSLDIDGNGTLEPDDVLAGPIFDPCGIFTVTPSDFTCDDIGQHTVIVEDGAGNFCWLTVFVEDLIPPTFIYPEDVTIECNGDIDPSVTGEPVIIDNCGTYGTSYFDQTIILPGNDILIYREWTIIEWLSGDTDTHIQVLDLDDDQTPVAVCVANLNISLDQFGMATLAPEAVDAGSYDDCGDVTLSVSPSTFDCSNIGDTIIVILTVTDESGNTNQCWTEVNVEDKIGPTAICNSTVNISLESDGLAVITPDIIDAGSNDNCGPVALSLSQSTFDCDDIDNDSLIVIMTVTDQSGNTNQCWTKIIVEASNITEDDIIWPDDTILACNADTDPAVTGEPFVLDNCEISGISYQDDIFVIAGNTIKILRNWIIIDWLSGEIFEYIQIIKTEDSTPPVAVCVSDINISLDASGNATLQPEAIDAGSYDECGGVSLSVSPSIFDCSNIGDSIVVILTVTDESGNTNQCWANVNIEDKIGPIAVCNSSVNISLGADGTATITPSVIDAGSYDNCGPVTLALSQTTFDCSDIGDSIVVIMTVTDQSGNTNQCWSEIVVEDNTLPDIVFPADITISCNGNTDPSATGEPVVTDNCGLFAFSFDDLIIQIVGDAVKILRTWTVIDWLTNDVVTHIQIIKTVDTTPPTAVCFSSINVSLDAIGNIILPPEAIDAGSYDDCGDVTLSVSPSTFDCSNIGDSIVVVLTVTDESGNTSQCWANVNIEDKIGPIAVCNSSVNISLGADGTATITPGVIDAGSFDNCGPVTLALSQSTFDCSDILNDSLIVIMTVTDGSGNTNQCWASINVEDKLPPVVICPPDVTIDCGQSGNIDPSITGFPTIIDNCDLTAYSYEDLIFPQGGANFNVLRKWIVVDWYSNTFDTCTQVITVIDLNPPNIVCLNQLSASLDANGSFTLFPQDLDNGTNDDCGTFELSISQSQFDCTDVGSNSVTLTATDENGNSSQCVVDVIIFGLDADEDGFSICDGDCDDSNGSISPGEQEVCGDNIDNNCDGNIDENCICASYAESTEYEWIETVDVNGTSHNSGNDNGYGDYTSIILPMSIGNNSIELTPGFAGSSYNEYWSVWIDMNQNGQYENSEEVLSQSSSNTITSTISIPTSALLGTTTMRVAMRYGQSSDPCEIFPEGEVEDYTVDISLPLYCISEGASTQYEWIKKVKLKSINNLSGNDNGYADFTNLSTNLNPGQSKNIKLKPGFSGSSYLEYWRVWVDWNDDGDFDDAGELEVQTSSSGNITDQITVPSSVSGGDKRMRVSMKYGGYPQPCETFTYGEVEDYTIFVTGSNPLVSYDSSLDLISSEMQTQSIADEVIDVRTADPELNVYLYPNPTSNFINIEFESSSEADRKLTMYNEVGQSVYQTTIDQSSITIDVTQSQFTNGLYVLMIQQGEQVMSKRVIISK